MVLIKCNLCTELIDPAEHSYWNIHLTKDKGRTQARGHLCENCQHKVMTQLHLIVTKRQLPFKDVEEK